jgi:hypothetical protein
VKTNWVRKKRKNCIFYLSSNLSGSKNKKRLSKEESLFLFLHSSIKRSFILQISAACINEQAPVGSPG